MPESYLVTSHRFQHRDVVDFEPASLEASDWGLPGRGNGGGDGPVIFASFNTLHKVSPDVFAVWVRILKAVPNSVLYGVRGGVGGWC